MKSVYFLILFGVLLISLPNQEAKAQLFFGIKGQVNNLSAPLVTERDLFAKQQNSTLNPGFGLILEYHFNEKIGIQTEFLYQEQQQSYFLTNSEHLINTTNVEYIRVPVLFRRTYSFENFSIAGLIGPVTGYGVRLRAGVTNLNFLYADYQELDFEEQGVRQFDMGILFGLGVEKMIANKLKTKLAFRYNFGFIDIMIDDVSTFYNRGLALDMGVVIPISKK